MPKPGAVNKSKGAGKLDESRGRAAGAELEEGSEDLEQGSEDQEGLEEGAEGSGGKEDEEGQEGAEGQEGSEGTEGEEGQEGSEGEEGAEDEDPRDAQIAELTARLEAVEKGPKKEAEAPKELTDEDWAKIEAEFGVNEVDGIRQPFGRQGVQKMFALMRGLADNFRQTLNNELGGFKKEAAISELAGEKGFEDIKAYRKGMDEFLKEFNPSLHSDQKLLKKAYIYAVGLGAKGKIKKAINGREIQRKINAGGAHGRPGGAGAKKTTATAGEIATAKRLGMGVEEYMRYKTKPLHEIEIPE